MATQNVTNNLLPGAFTWNDVGSSTSVTLVPNNGYYNVNANAVQYTLPTVSAVGDLIRIVTVGGSWAILAGNNSQQVSVGTHLTPTGNSGNAIVSSTQSGDAISIVCCQNNVWCVYSGIGNYVVV